jgi:hypothetical protein
LVVDANPECNIPIQNLEFLPGKVFPLGMYSQKACDSSEQLRNAFPLGAMLLNFLLAMLLLHMIVRIFNRVTDNTKTDIIEGLD